MAINTNSNINTDNKAYALLMTTLYVLCSFFILSNPLSLLIATSAIILTTLLTFYIDKQAKDTNIPIIDFFANILHHPFSKECSPLGKAIYALLSLALIISLYFLTTNPITPIVYALSVIFLSQSRYLQGNSNSLTKTSFFATFALYLVFTFTPISSDLVILYMLPVAIAVVLTIYQEMRGNTPSAKSSSHYKAIPQLLAAAAIVTLPLYFPYIDAAIQQIIPKITLGNNTLLIIAIVSSILTVGACALFAYKEKNLSSQTITPAATPATTDTTLANQFKAFQGQGYKLGDNIPPKTTPKETPRTRGFPCSW